MGGTTAIDTLASASFTGASSRSQLGVILQRALVVLSLFYVPIAIIWTFSELIFQALGQDENIARNSSQFLMYLIPGGLGYIYFESIKKYLQAQGLMRAGTYVLLATSPLNALLNILFVHTMGFGYLGAPIATGISYWLSFILLLVYTVLFSDRECWGGFDRSCFRNVMSFARIAILGVIHVGTEFWAFEIVAIVAGQLGTLELATQSVIMTADIVLNTIPFGIGVAVSTRIGNKLGGKDIRKAALAAHGGITFSIIFGFFVCAGLYVCKDSFGYLFNDDRSVVELISRVIPFVALFQVADGLNGSCGGVLRGQAKQHVGAAINLLSYYCFALPLGIYLAFHGWGVVGLWIGLCAALYCVAVLEWILVIRSDWPQEVKAALGRLDA
jgi:MATE family multidrug resistance protein